MPIVVRCPNPACGVPCSVAEAATGRPVKCDKCGKSFSMRPTLDGRQADTKKGRPSTSADPFPSLPAEFGRYRVLRLLGKGGMGAVYLADDTHLKRRGALKIPFFDATESAQRAERFVREARSAAALHHPNICTVFDAGQIDGRPFITMAYVEGKPLADEIDPDAPMAQLRAAEVARKIARALEHAHGKGTVHRDLKPANVMMTADGEPVVMDFGLAKRVADVDPSEAKLTRLGGVVGTPSYMSPEQVRGAGDIGPATDVYSLGVMLFEMLAGKTPYAGSQGVVMGQIIHAPVPPVREFRADVDAGLDAICQQAMAKEPAARFASMAEFAAALDRYPQLPVSAATLDMEADAIPSQGRRTASVMPPPLPPRPSGPAKGTLRSRGGDHKEVPARTNPRASSPPDRPEAPRASNKGPGRGIVPSRQGGNFFGSKRGWWFVLGSTVLVVAVVSTAMILWQNLGKTSSATGKGTNEVGALSADAPLRTKQELSIRLAKYPGREEWVKKLETIVDHPGVESPDTKLGELVEDIRTKYKIDFDIDKEACSLLFGPDGNVLDFMPCATDPILPMRSSVRKVIEAIIGRLPRGACVQFDAENRRAIIRSYAFLRVDVEATVDDMPLREAIDHLEVNFKLGIVRDESILALQEKRIKIPAVAKVPLYLVLRHMVAQIGATVVVEDPDHVLVGIRREGVFPPPPKNPLEDSK